MVNRFIEHMNCNFHRDILYLRHPQKILELENNKVEMILQDEDVVTLIVKECINKGINNKNIGIFSISGDYYIITPIEFSSLIQDVYTCNKLIGHVKEKYKVTTLK